MRADVFCGRVRMAGMIAEKYWDDWPAKEYNILILLKYSIDMLF